MPQSCGHCWAAHTAAGLSNLTLSSQRPATCFRARWWEGTQLGQLTQTEQRYSPARGITLSNKKLRDGTFVVKAHVPKQLLHILGPCIPGSDWTSAWWQEVENKYPLLASVFYAAFTFLIRLLLSQPLSLFIFYLPDLLRKWIKRTTGSGSQLRSPHHHIYFRAKIDAAHSEVMLGSGVAINLYFRLPQGSQLCWHNRSPRTPTPHSHSWFNKTGQCYLCQF